MAAEAVELGDERRLRRLRLSPASGFEDLVVRCGPLETAVAVQHTDGGRPGLRASVCPPAPSICSLFLHSLFFERWTKWRVPNIYFGI
jgi:hypothetical protein